MKYSNLYIFLIIFFISVESNKTVFAENYFYQEQSSNISGKIKLYYNSDNLIINLKQTKIWIIAKRNDSKLTIINTKNKLFITEPYEFYLGNSAQRIMLGEFKNLKTSQWNLISHENHFNEKMSVYIKHNLTYKDNYICSKDNFGKFVTKDKSNFRYVECTTFDKYPLTACQSYVIYVVYGLKYLYNIPYNSIIVYANNKKVLALNTSQVGKVNLNLNAIFDLSKFKQVKHDYQVYDYSSNLSKQINDFLNM